MPNGSERHHCNVLAFKNIELKLNHFAISAHFDTMIVLAILLAIGAESRCLRIATKKSVPFSFVPDDPAAEGVGVPEMFEPWGGFTFDYLARQMLPLVEQHASDLGIVGIDFSCAEVTEFPNNTEALKAVGDGRFDVAAASITPTEPREILYRIDFTTPYKHLGQTMVVRDSTSFFETMLRTLDTLGETIGLYLLTFTILVLSGMLLLYIGEKRYNGPIRAWDDSSTDKELVAAAQISAQVLAGSPAFEPRGTMSGIALTFLKTIGPMITIIVTALLTAVMVSNNAQ